MQLWQIPPASGTGAGQVHCIERTRPLIIPPLLGCWETRRYGFNWRDAPLLEPLQLHGEHQHDALRHSWTGLRSRVVWNSSKYRGNAGG